MNYRCKLSRSLKTRVKRSHVLFSANELPLSGDRPTRQCKWQHSFHLTVTVAVCSKPCCCCSAVHDSVLVHRSWDITIVNFYRPFLNWTPAARTRENRATVFCVGGLGVEWWMVWMVDSEKLSVDQSSIVVINVYKRFLFFYKKRVFNVFYFSNVFYF